MLPTERVTTSGSPGPNKIVLNLERLQNVPSEDAGPLVRFAAAIQRERGSYAGADIIGFCIGGEEGSEGGNKGGYFHVCKFLGKFVRY